MYNVFTFILHIISFYFIKVHLYNLEFTITFTYILYTYILYSIYPILLFNIISFFILYYTKYSNKYNKLDYLRTSCKLVFPLLVAIS